MRWWFASWGDWQVSRPVRPWRRGHDPGQGRSEYGRSRRPAPTGNHRAGGGGLGLATTLLIRGPRHGPSVKMRWLRHAPTAIGEPTHGSSELSIAGVPSPPESRESTCKRRQGEYTSVRRKTIFVAGGIAYGLAFTSPVKVTRLASVCFSTWRIASAPLTRRGRRAHPARHLHALRLGLFRR